MKRKASTAAVALLVVLAGVSIEGGAASRPAGACARPEAVAGVGLACKTADGRWRVVLEDGYTFTTHGVDLVQSPFEAPIRPRPVRCVPSTHFRIEVFYANAAGTTNRYSSLKPELLKMVEAANGLIYDEGARFARPSLLRMRCSGTRPYITGVTLPTPKSRTTIETVIRDLRGLGYTDPRAKYWVWFDGTLYTTVNGQRIQIGGTGTMLLDDRLAASNANLFGASYSAIWGHRLSSGGHVTMVHEGFHNLGAVQISAPHSTKAGHCTDGVDVMCYPDGGPLQGFYSSSKCTTRVALDCRNDDYFHPAPTSSNYLSKHWNVASPYNRFLAGCAVLEGTLGAPGAGQDPEAQLPAEARQSVIARSARIPTTCAGRLFAVGGVIEPPPQEVHSLQGNTSKATIPTESPVGGGTSAWILPWAQMGQQEPTDYLAERYAPDLDVCFYKVAKLLKCFTGAADRGIVPTGTDTVRVILTAGAAVHYVFSAL